MRSGAESADGDARAGTVASPRTDRDILDYLRKPASESDAADRDELRSVQLLLDACAIGMLLLSERGQVLLLNRAAAHTFGYARAELVGEPIERVLPHLPRDRRPSERPGGFGTERAGVRQDGSPVQLEVSFELLPWNGGAYRLAQIVDIDDRKRAELEARAREHELERSNAELAAFASVAAHDLREPLRSVVYCTETLAGRYSDTLDVTGDLMMRQAVAGAKRMQRLIDDLLTCARIKDGDQQIANVSMEATLAWTLSALQALIDEAQATFVIGAMPVVLGDQHQLARLLQNLIHNAIKFRSELTPRVRIASERQGDSWHFTVEDNGIGIARECHQRVFEPFQRLHPRAAYDGGGMGLAIAKRIVERHGGKIWLDSEPGQGSTFHFKLQAATELRRNA